MWAPFFAIFGVVMTQLGYEARVRGFVTYIPQQGPQEILSPTLRPALYWAVSSGMIILGVLCLVLSAYAALCLFRACRAEGVRRVFHAPPFGIFMFGLGFVGIIITLLLGRCSHP